METVADCIFLGSKITADSDCSHEVKRRLLLGRRAMTNLESILKSKDITLPTKDKGSYSQRNNWCFQTVGLEKTIESPSDSKEIKPVNPKGNQPWIFIGRTDAEAVPPILWPPDTQIWLTGKKSWCWKRLRVERETGNRRRDSWRQHQFNGHEFEQTLGNSKGQGCLACCSPRGHKESDMT